MPYADALLEVSRVLVSLGLAVFVGIPLARFFGWMTRGEEKEEEKIFLEKEEGEASGAGLGRARFVAAGALLIGVLLEVQVMGSSLPPRHVWRAGALFLLVASLVYSVMVVAPRERYYRDKSFSLEEGLRQPWASRADAVKRKNVVVGGLGFVLALAALVLG